MPIITKAEHMFSTGVFNSYCATLHFDYRVNPNVAERINFDIKNVEHLPALTVMEFFNEEPRYHHYLYLHNTYSEAFYLMLNLGKLHL